MSNMSSPKLLNYGLAFSCLIGLGLSIYSYMVELAVEQDQNYVAMCDINEHMSCTKAFKSKYGKGFGIVGRILGEHSSLNQPNSLAGIIFYSFLATVAHSESRLINIVALIAAGLSNCASIYFAYILIFILHDFCIVCVSIYVVNFVNLMLVYTKVTRTGCADQANADQAKLKNN